MIKEIRYCDRRHFVFRCCLLFSCRKCLRWKTWNFVSFEPFQIWIQVLSAKSWADSSKQLSILPLFQKKLKSSIFFFLRKLWVYVRHSCLLNLFTGRWLTVRTEPFSSSKISLDIHTVVFAFTVCCCALKPYSRYPVTFQQTQDMLCWVTSPFFLALLCEAEELASPGSYRVGPWRLWSHQWGGFIYLLSMGRLSLVLFEREGTMLFRLCAFLGLTEKKYAHCRQSGGMWNLTVAMTSVVLNFLNSIYLCIDYTSIMLSNTSSLHDNKIKANSFII